MKSNNRKERSASSAPGKLMLFGEHAVVYGHPCIVTAVDERIQASITKTKTGTIVLETPETNIEVSLNKINNLKKQPKEAKFVLSAIKTFTKKYGGVEGIRVETKNAFSNKFGFGSSSAVTVAVLHSLHNLYKKRFTKKSLFSMAYQSVLDVQGVGSGFDIAAAVWGGTLYYVTGGKSIETLPEIPPLLVAYTGVKAQTVPLVKKVALLKNENPQIVNAIFDDIDLIVKQAKQSIKSKDWNKLGQLMNFNQGLLESLGVSSPIIHETCDELIQKGVIGTKLSGAGGGDCVIAVFNLNNKKISSSKIIDVKLQAPGVRSE